MKIWPSIKTPEEVLPALDYMTRERGSDITEFDNLENVFMRGRKVGKIPTSSTDVVSTDSVGDFNYTNSYLYLLVMDGADAKWRRVALGSF